MTIINNCKFNDDMSHIIWTAILYFSAFQTLWISVSVSGMVRENTEIKRMGTSLDNLMCAEPNSFRFVRYNFYNILACG